MAYISRHRKLDFKMEVDSVQFGMKALENTFTVSFGNWHTWHYNAPDIAQNLPDSRANSSYWYIIEPYIFHLTDTFIFIVTRLLSYKNLE